MQAWIGHIQGLVFRMEQSGVEVSDQDKIIVLTMGLPPSYDPVIINFDATPSQLLTLNNIIVHLLNEAVHQSSDSKVAKDTGRSYGGHRWGARVVVEHKTLWELMSCACSVKEKGTSNLIAQRNEPGRS